MDSRENKTNCFPRDLTLSDIQYIMIAKPIRALELHYPMIQFFIKLDIFFSVQNILYVF